MKNKKTYYLLVLDRSGSMQDCVQETISGFNEQIQMIRDLQKRFPEQEFRVSLTIFNHLVDHPFETVDIQKVKELTTYSYIPDGSTALLDAVGDSVIRLKHAIAGEIQRDEATAVVVILTDGYENASQEFSFERVSKMIKELEKSDSWTFSFLGTTRESIDAARRMNISKQNSAVYDKSDTLLTYHNLAHAMEEYIEAKDIGMKKKDFLKK
jgi:uncharacterized protein YegL